MELNVGTNTLDTAKERHQIDKPKIGAEVVEVIIILDGTLLTQKQQNNNRNDSQERRYNNQQRDENRNAYYGPQPFKRGRFFEQSQDRSRQGSVSSATSTYSGRTQTTNNGRNTYNPQTELHNIEEVPNFTIAASDNQPTTWNAHSTDH